jgi:hypothetical protein
MKTCIIVFSLLLILLGCKKERNDSLSYLIKNYENLVIKSFDSIVYVNIPGGESYFRFVPDTNRVLFSFDIDQDLRDDYRLDISHFLYIGSPDFRYNAQVVTITSLDTSYKVAVQQDSEGSEVIAFSAWDTIGNSRYYHTIATILADVPYVNGYMLTGNAYIGLRIGSDPAQYKFGYLNFIIDGAKVTLIRSVLNTNQDNCLVQE